MSAKDKGTGKEQQIRIQASGGLSDDDIEKMVKEAELNAEADKKRREAAEARNQAEALIHSTEKTLEEHGDKVSADDKAAIDAALADLKTAVAAEDVAEIQAKSQTLAAASMKLGEAMYQAAQEDTEHEVADQHGDGSAGAEEVVDADFEEIPDDDGDSAQESGESDEDRKKSA